MKQSKLIQVLQRRKRLSLLLVLTVAIGFLGFTTNYKTALATNLKRLQAGSPIKGPSHENDWHFLGEGDVEPLDIENVTGFYHGRNVCLRGNYDGIYFTNATQYSVYNATKRGTKPLEFYRAQDTPESQRKFFRGNSYISNCWRRWPEDTNPAHWAMKLGTLFFLSNTKSKKNILSKSDRIVFHQCANPFNSKWEWGIALWNITLANFVRKNNPLVFWTEGELPGRDKLIGNSTYYCFENAFWDQRYGIWILKESIREWYSAVLRYFPHLTGAKSQELHIAIFERKDGSALRKFENLGDLIRVVGKYTNKPVQIISVDKSTSVHEQVLLFNSFDILLTSHGSHLANILFSTRKMTVIEIVSCTSDMVFSQNAEILGINYIISSGHLLGRTCNDTMGKSYSRILGDYNHQGLLKCEGILNTKQCNIQVNLTKIETMLDAIHSERSVQKLPSGNETIR